MAEHLNDLDGKAWIKETKSWWRSRAPKRDPRKKDHPATFSELDVERIIRFFTKADDAVLDPFVGTGSTLLACAASGRLGTGIELSPRWAKVAKARTGEVPRGHDQTLLEGDTREILPTLPDEAFRLVVTSPPYWSILRKPADHKTKAERLSEDLATDYGDEEGNLELIGDYQGFLDQLDLIWRDCHRVLQDPGHLVIIASDVREKGRLVPLPTDLARRCEDLGFRLAGLTMLVQDDKRLYPYGFPTTYVPNIHHQTLVILRKA